MATGQLLLVEDEDLERRALAHVLARAGYAVEEAATAEEGLRLLHHYQYDLLLVDLALPGMDGLEFLAEANSTPNMPGALIITGYGSLENASRAMELGAGSLLTKPVVHRTTTDGSAQCT